MRIERYSFGIGDRFRHQGVAQLRALEQAAAWGAAVTPVWNTSHREHTLLGTVPSDTRAAAQAAVAGANWTGPYRVDADHVTRKTAGTTWLEEVAGLAAADGEALVLAKTVYRETWQRRDACCAPYAAVIHIDPARLPHPDDVAAWDADTFVRAVRHDTADPLFRSDMRQLLHVGYPVAAEMGTRFTEALDAHASAVAEGVTSNLCRHLELLFGPETA